MFFYLGRAGEANGSSLSHNKYFFQSTGGPIAFIGTLISFGSSWIQHYISHNGMVISVTYKVVKVNLQGKEIYKNNPQNIQVILKLKNK